MTRSLDAEGPRGAVRVDGRDVGSWSGTTATPVAGDPRWRERATAYVAAHPRVDSQGVAGAQRLALLRRLAAGPATTLELLAALRTVGWVGADDLENRLRDLRAGDRRAGPALTGIRLAVEDGVHRLVEPFPALGEADLRALAFAKAVVGRLQGPLATGASAALDHLLPGVAVGPTPRGAVPSRATARDYERFEAARQDRRAVLVRYFSLNSGREGRYLLVPVEYVTVGATVKAICVRVDGEGRRAEDFDRQFALDRLLGVEVVEEQPVTPRRAVRLQRAEITLQLSDTLYQVSRQRDLFGLGSVDGEQDPYDQSWKVRGRFALALAWDVMEQLCAWSGQVQVHEPLWLVNAVVRRLRAGLQVMEAGAAFELVKPEPRRRFADHGEAIAVDDPLPEPTGPRRLDPPGRARSR